MSLWGHVSVKFDPFKALFQSISSSDVTPFIVFAPVQQSVRKVSLPPQSQQEQVTNQIFNTFYN